MFNLIYLPNDSLSLSKIFEAWRSVTCSVASGTKTESPQYTYEYEYEYYDDEGKNASSSPAAAEAKTTGGKITGAAVAQVPETTERETTSSLLSLLTFLGMSFVYKETQEC